MPEEGLMGIDITQVLGWAVTIAIAVLTYVLKLQNDRDKALQDQLNAIRARVEECEKSAIRGEFVNVAIENLKDDIEKLETKMESNFNKLLDTFEGIARRLEIPAIRRD